MTYPKIQIDSLPNPRLHGFLRPDYETLSKDKKREAIRDAHLAAAGLPEDYRELTGKGMRLARNASLRSWYDPDKPSVLCNNVENFLKALFLWNEFYIKPAECNRGKYHYRDPKHKYQIARLAMSDAKTPSEPAKTALHAPRGTAKTYTAIQEMVPMMAITRPYTEILVSEYNQDRTREEMKKIRMGIEQNDIIHQEFGDKGVLFPNSRSSYSWMDSDLQFMHQPGSRIMGYSFKSAHRGRHPIYGVIDDGESKEMIRNAELRRQYLDDLFAIYMPMFKRGGKVLMMGTLSNPNSVLMMALEGIISFEDDEHIGQRDERFDDWHRERIRMIYENDEGDLESSWPDYCDVDAFEVKKRTLGVSKAMLEFQGEAVANADLAFPRSTLEHGYMRAKEENDPDGIEWFVDLKTGNARPWSDFLSEIYSVVAVDLADSRHITADYGCAVCLGVDSVGTLYVLDVVMKKQEGDKLVRDAFFLGAEWKSKKIGFERGGMQNYVVRDARKYAHELEEYGYCHVPRFFPIDNSITRKEEKILGTLRPLFRRNEIRFLVRKRQDVVGKTYIPVKYDNWAAHRLLLQQLDLYTDDGPTSHDDGPDALQMAVRLISGRRGKVLAQSDPNEIEYKRWKNAGIHWDPRTIPPDAWPMEMRERMSEQSRLKAMAMDSEEYVDPYDMGI